MSKAELEKRVAVLERQVAALLAEKNGAAGLKGVPEQDQGWRSALGMFTGDETMKAIDAAGRKLREAERRKARRQPATHKRRAGR